MHLGIVFLILIKKKYKDIEIKFYYKNIYLSFGLFIPILIYKLLAAIFWFEENKAIIRNVSYTLIVLCIIVAIINLSVFLKNYKN